MIELLDIIINPKVKNNIYEAKYGGYAVRYIETSSTKLESITINGLDPDNSLAFTLDFKNALGKCDAYYNQLSKYFNKATKYINQGCDIVILTKRNNKWYLLLSEMKSERISEDDFFQLKNSEYFINWVLELAKANSVNLLGADNIKNKPEIKKIIFKSQNGSVKKTTRVKDQKKPDEKNGVKIYPCTTNNYTVHIGSLLS